MGYYLSSLTELISQRHPPNNTPKYLNIRGLISEYKRLKQVIEDVELPESGFEIEWYSSNLVLLMIAICVAKKCIPVKLQYAMGSHRITAVILAREAGLETKSTVDRICLQRFLFTDR